MSNQNSGLSALRKTAAESVAVLWLQPKTPQARVSCGLAGFWHLFPLVAGHHILTDFASEICCPVLLII